ncbi:hypothetical protein PEPS_11930 [Persicobacter psychrovividus]|uniref:Uncharacterized protein n=1 Tax=Persicobacter psychrovividus TaxID=387638 RepID=A0ABM7VD89_9BACT|nr:hypothetical protein PEPS_11930 [Persicobacter psychrovividus]
MGFFAFALYNYSSAKITVDGAGATFKCKKPKYGAVLDFLKGVWPPIIAAF